MRDQYLIEIEEFETLYQNSDVRVVDTRDEETYRQGHIPGAVNIPEIFTFLLTEENGGLPGLQTYFKDRLGQAGIGRENTVIFYEDAMDNGYGQSCRGRFLLNYFGHKNVRVLHGGYRIWKKKQLKISTDVSTYKPKQYELTINPEEMLSTEEMKALLNDPSFFILDCRDHAEWVGATSSPYGVDFCPRKGRIPGAVWIEWYEMMYRKDQIPWIKPNEQILEICSAAGITEDTKVMIYCFKGARASNVLMTLKMAGIKNVKNYLGSWNEWSRDFSLPIDEGYPEF